MPLREYDAPSTILPSTAQIIMEVLRLILFSIDEEYYDSSKIIHFDDFVYRSPLDPDTAILIPETRPPYVSDGINKTQIIMGYIELAQW